MARFMTYTDERSGQESGRDGGKSGHRHAITLRLQRDVCCQVADVLGEPVVSLSSKMVHLLNALKRQLRHGCE